MWGAGSKFRPTWLGWSMLGVLGIEMVAVGVAKFTPENRFGGSVTELSVLRRIADWREQDRIP